MKFPPLLILSISSLAFFLYFLWRCSPHQLDMVQLSFGVTLFFYMGYRAFLRAGDRETASKRLLAVTAVFSVTPIFAFLFDQVISSSANLRPIRLSVWIAVLIMFLWLRLLSKKKRN
jgi:hypothetical protein